MIDKALDIIEGARERIAEARRKQIAVWEGDKSIPLPLLMGGRIPGDLQKSLSWYSTKEIHYDLDKMFHNGLLNALSAVCGGADAVPSMRANMGCGIFPSLMGVMPLLFDDKMPWVKDHLTKEQLSQMTPDDITITEEFAMAVKHMQYMAKKLGDSPVHIYPPDLQGPFDTAHIVYGDAIFYDIYDDPAFVHHLLDLSCHAIVLGMEKSLEVIPGADGVVAHYNNLVIPGSMGGLKISEDTSTLLSPHSIDEFVVPYTTRVLEHFGGGYIHYCGKNDYLLEAVLGIDKNIGLNFGDPQKHDMDAVLKQVAAAGKVFYGSVNRQQSETDRDFFKRVRDASNERLLLVFDVGDKDTGEVIADWEESGV